jgi:hypothetical protein
MALGYVNAVSVRGAGVKPSDNISPGARDRPSPGMRAMRSDYQTLWLLFIYIAFGERRFVRVVDQTDQNGSKRSV